MEVDCEEDCMACSGEVCMRHDGPCDCDTADRHVDINGTVFYGGPQGMVPIDEPNPQDY
jgi:hypothetical protein